MARAKSTILTAQQKAFVESKIDGKSDRQAAKDANYNSGAITKLSHNDLVRDKIAAGKAQVADACMLKRVDVIDGIIEAIGRAKQMSEPATEIRGWVEVGKMLGFDKPEQVRRQLSVHAAQLQNQLFNMTTAELLEMAAGNMHIDGTAERVD